MPIKLNEIWQRISGTLRGPFMSPVEPAGPSAAGSTFVDVAVSGLSEKEVAKLPYEVSKAFSRLSKSGTQISYGKIQGYEDNDEFSDAGSWAAKARKMKREDPRPAALDMILRHIVKSPQWQAKPASKRRNAKRNAAYVNELFGWDGKTTRMDRPWEQILNSIACYAGVGFWVVEKIFKYEDGKVWLRDLVDLEPDTIDGWFPDQNGDLAYIHQTFYASGEPAAKPLPAYKSLIFTMNKTGRNFEGVGLLRPASIWFDLKAILTNMAGIGAQKWATPVIKTTINRDAPAATAYTEDQINDMIKYTHNQARAFQTGAQSFLSDTPVATLSTFGEGKYDGIKSIIEAIRLCDHQMAIAYMNTWIDLGGPSQPGNRALGEVQSDWGKSLCGDILDNIRDVLCGKSRPGGGVIDELLRINFYDGVPVPADEMPIIEHSGVNASALADAISLLPALIGAGILKVDVALENAVRDLIDVPRVEEAAVETEASNEAVLTSNTEGNGNG